MVILVTIFYVEVDGSLLEVKLLLRIEVDVLEVIFLSDRRSMMKNNSLF